jgi:hypothetical protein
VSVLDRALSCLGSCYQQPPAAAALVIATAAAAAQFGTPISEMCCAAQCHFDDQSGSASAELNDTVATWELGSLWCSVAAYVLCCPRYSSWVLAPVWLTCFMIVFWWLMGGETGGTCSCVLSSMPGIGQWPLASSLGKSSWFLQLPAPLHTS